MLKEGATSPVSNETGEGAEELVLTVELQPGDSVWCWMVLQVFAVNGADVSAALTTDMSTTTLQTPILN